MAPCQPIGSKLNVLVLSSPSRSARGRLPIPCPSVPIGMTSTMSGHPVIMKVEPGLAPAPEIVRELGLDLPALRRHELGIAGILAVLAELRLGEEIVEADLADAAAQLEADVPVLGRDASQA